MLIENNRRPLNESETHFILKQIGKYILRTRGCKIIGTEIDIGYDGKTPIFNDVPDFFKRTNKRVIDVVGVKCSNSNWRKDSKTIGIESKASLSDYKNGFCTRCDYTYVIAPINTIPIDKVPKDIGLIEVDLDNYKPINGCDFESVYFTKQAKNRKKIINSDLFYYEEMIYNIANRYSNDDIFNQCQIKTYDIDELTLDEINNKLGFDFKYQNIDNARKELKRLRKVK